MDAASYAYEYCLGDGHRAPTCIAQSAAAEAGDFLRSVRWSPDGNALAAVSDSGALEIHDMSGIVEAYYGGQEVASEIGPPALSVPHASGVLAYSWYPHMQSQAPETCCIVESSRDHPVQLRDTKSGRVRASYPAFDDKDGLMSASALDFSGQQQHFLAGYDACLARFDVMRPGLPLVQRGLSPSRRSRDGMKGLVSCVAQRAGVAACATFAGHLGLRSADLEDIASWQVPVEYRGAGVTDLRWASDVVVWAAQRRAKYLVAWDVRDLRSPVMAVERPARGRQRLAIDCDRTGRHLVAGTEDGSVLFYDTKAEMCQVSVVADDVVAAVAAHPYYPILATASGQRQFNGDATKLNCLKIWTIESQYFM
ncbi:hypothetical protein GGI03_006129 [Coemansia sp. RSA 2337]|nr:hypothetical protein LPJ71_005375 [Coemansia sp. S17]KAJ2053868.1 hypothetical protein H4S04_000396 [Coemansia sp. S16]KAJ2116730.1 hypothetical protein IW146_001304 [Coemansia sp. RSA 922]KAJ2457336.1 hypothetical protein GGI03_006129 [Coemansia sp. RSA 2337]